jgi:hypothetical protein
MSDAFQPTELSDALARHGLILRGGFDFAEGEGAPPGPSGEPACSVVLVGHGGGSIWSHFQTWLKGHTDTSANPLDDWSRAVLDAIAGDFGARAVFPSDQPYLPFQRWAMKAEGLKLSPLGILIHPEFGLWHAYRGALLFDVERKIQLPAEPIHLCDLCDGKPCLSSCPANAVSMNGFNVMRCGEHVQSNAGSDCRERGCLARSACPLDSYRYNIEQVAFHMAAYLRGTGSA